MDLKMKIWVVSVFSSDWEHDQLTGQTLHVYDEARIIGTFLTRSAAGRAMVQTKKYVNEYGARRGFEEKGTSLAHGWTDEGRKFSEIDLYLFRSDNNYTKEKKEFLDVSIKMEQMSIGSMCKYECYGEEES